MKLADDCALYCLRLNLAPDTLCTKQANSIRNTGNSRSADQIMSLRGSPMRCEHMSRRETICSRKQELNRPSSQIATRTCEARRSLSWKSGIKLLAGASQFSCNARCRNTAMTTSALGSCLFLIHQHGNACGGERLRGRTDSYWGPGEHDLP